MVSGRSRTAFNRFYVAPALTAAALAVAAPARADVELAPGPTGGLGALLVAGPLLVSKSQKRPVLAGDFALPDGVTEGAPNARAGGLADEARKQPWSLVASKSGAIDLAAFTKAQGVEATAIAAGVLRVTEPLVGYLVVGVDDGCVAYLDGKAILTQDAGRPEGDETVPIELSVGDHPLLFKLHQRGGGWALRLRITDRALAAARGVSLVLAGDIDESKLAADLAEVSVLRGLGPHGLAPSVTVRTRGGLPRGAARDVVVTTAIEGGASLVARVGRVPLEPGGPASDLVALLPPLAENELAQGPEVRFDVAAFGAHATFAAPVAPTAIAALAHADAAIARIGESDAFLRDRESTLATIEHLADRLRYYAGKGDLDVRAQSDEARALDAFVSAIDRRADPFLTARGPLRVAYRSPFDGRPSPFGLYLPKKGLDPAKRYPLVVALHGLNGKPLNMMRWFFGLDDASHDGEWEDRHADASIFPDVDAIVVTPMAHGNAMYRYLAEDDVMNVVAWAKRLFPIDDARVSITGPSMGGTGTAAIAFKHADEFSSAAPLCGYHSWSLRGDFSGKRRPWETQQGADRSTVEWAENGLHLPLFIVHGTRDLPIENSGVLIDRYKALGYSLLEEHPDEGHNVWQPTYEGLKGFSWLTSWKRPAHPTRVVLRTDDLRVDHHAWVHLARLERSGTWGEVRATAKKGKTPRVDVATKGVAAFRLDRDEALFGVDAPIEIKVDGAALSFGPGEALELERAASGWKKGITAPATLVKRGGLAGPIRDVFHEPVIVVVGTLDPMMTRANEELAHHFAAVRGGFDVAYPIVRDVDLAPTLAATHALVLVGGAQSNAITRALDGRLPIHVTHEPPAVRVGERTFAGDDVGAAFIHPNPDHPDRYVVVLAGASVGATRRAMALPDLLPDWLVFDRGLAPARGQMILGSATLRAGGLFDERWGILPD